MKKEEHQSIRAKKHVSKGPYVKVPVENTFNVILTLIKRKLSVSRFILL
jgi:hypothetical protein